MQGFELFLHFNTIQIFHHIVEKMNSLNTLTYTNLQNHPTG
jgi:hypothetical protein